MTGVSRWRRVLGVLALVVCSKAGWAQAPASNAQPSAEAESWFPPAAECSSACGTGERCNAEGQCELVETRPADPPPPVVDKPEKPPEEKPKVASTEWQTPAKKPTSLPYRHDGFFLRLAIGGAYSSASGSLDTADDGSPGERGFDLTGGGLTIQIAMGGTLRNGLVIGGLSQTSSVISPIYELEGGSEVEGESAAQGVAGPFVAYYFDPEAGFHVQFAAGLALVRLPIENAFTVNALGFVAGAGYDFFVGRELSIGLLGTFQLAAGSLRGQETGGDGHVISRVFGGLVSATYH
jgi:hypothetical protein